MKKIFKFITPVVLIFSGCDDEKVNLLNKNFVDTNIGTIKDKQLVVYKEPEKKAIEKIEKVVVTPAKVVKKPKKPSISVQEKKKHFKEILIPIVTMVYNDLERQYQDVKKDLNNSTNLEYTNILKKRYKCKTDTELLQALKPHPISIVLAQAAIESAWLTSRFTKNANNIFGVWSFNKKEPRIAATGLRGDKTIYLKKYKNLKSAVEDYFFNISKSWAYEEFRAKRVSTNNPYELVVHLESYSEKGVVYTDMLKRVIKYNKFDKYDIR